MQERNKEIEKKREVIYYEKKNIAALIAKIIIGVIILGCLIISFINSANILINNGQAGLLVIGCVIVVGFAIAYNLLDKEEH